jgi:serine/threonine-protein kinase
MIGPYSVDRELGRGGMGVVYLATDPRLDRRVAIKALPEHLAADPERLARFEREAKTLASLSHANVAGIYGVEEHAGRRYLVLEYVEGETLAERLDRGALPIDEALEIADQIAAGVEAAHDAGVIHRDLKPGNVIVTPDGRAKVLDFGLARSEESTSASGSSMSPTLTSPAGSPTVPGVIMGTAAYMSPEQARGRRVDRRADIWSFGVMLYEMLTGASPFVGETVSDSIGAILHKNIDLDRLPPGTPRQVRHVLRRCLERDKDKRYRDIGDARLDLRMRAPSVDAQAGAPVRPRPAALVAMALAMVVVGAGAWLAGGAMTTDRARAPEPMHLAIPTRMAGGGEGAMSSAFGVAHQTKRFVFVGAPDDGPDRVYVRAIDEPEARVLPGTEHAQDVSVSPDGRVVLFEWNDPDSVRIELRRISIDGGPVTTLLASDRGPGYDLLIPPVWLTPTSVLLVGDNRLRFFELSLETLAVTPALRIDEVVEGGAFGIPWATLPGGRRVLASVAVLDPERGPVFDLFGIDLDQKTAKRVLTETDEAVVFDGGRRIAFVRGDTLSVARFDSATSAVVGEFLPLHSPIEEFLISPDGDLYYTLGAELGGGVRPIAIDLTGRREPIIERRLFFQPFVDVSPDGRALGLMTVPEPNGPPTAQTLDIATGFLAPVVGGREVTGAPVWLRDDEVIFSSYISSERSDLQRIRLGDESTRAPVTGRADGPGIELMPTVSPDGRWIAYQFSRGFDTPLRSIFLAPLAGDGEPRPIVQSGGIDSMPAFDPLGEYLAYASNSAGENRVVMQAFDTENGALASRVIPVSRAEGVNPVWSPDGAFVYFVDPSAGSLLRVAIERDPALRIGAPEVALTAAQLEGLDVVGPRQFDIFPDGERFVFIERIPEASDNQPYINVTLNWLTELQSRMPVE